MRIQLLAHSLLLLPVLFAVACAASPIPPAHLSPMANNENPPMVAKNATGTLGTIERLDPALDALLAPDAKVEILVEGIHWSEGPVWADDGLFFSDVRQNTIYHWTQKDGVKPYLQPSGYNNTAPRGGEPGSNGLTLDLDGHLVICQHGNRRVARLEADGTITPLADQMGGKRFNSPNDLCFDTKGNFYFTDPPYGMIESNRELDVNGVYFVPPGGKPRLLPTDTISYADGKTAPLKFPNGIAISPDGKGLYVAVSDPKNPVIVRYDLQPDGVISNGKVFFDSAPLVAKKLQGLPDGFKFDTKGNIWLGGPGGLLIISPEGKHLGTLLTGVPTANCAWGDDGSTLYICANHNVCRIKTKTMGSMPPKSK